MAHVPELPGCTACGASYEEAFRAVQGAAAAWIERAEKNEFQVPQPSGRAVLEWIQAAKLAAG